MHYLQQWNYCPECGSKRFVEHDFKSKRCEDCGFTYYFNAAAAVIAIIENEKGELLVARRGEEPAKGTLDFIGGFVDPGEGFEEAVLREIEEETGYRVKLDDEVQRPVEILFSLPNTYLYSGMVIHSCDCIFRVFIPSDAPLNANDDVAACWWEKPEHIKVEDFGLDSAQIAFQRFLEEKRTTEKNRK